MEVLRIQHKLRIEILTTEFNSLPLTDSKATHHLLATALMSVACAALLAEFTAGVADENFAEDSVHHQTNVIATAKASAEHFRRE